MCTYLTEKIELSQESARALAKAIEAVLESAPPGLE